MNYSSLNCVYYAGFCYCLVCDLSVCVKSVGGYRTTQTTLWVWFLVLTWHWFQHENILHKSSLEMYIYIETLHFHKKNLSFSFVSTAMPTFEKHWMNLLILSRRWNLWSFFTYRLTKKGQSNHSLIYWTRMVTGSIMLFMHANPAVGYLGILESS